MTTFAAVGGFLFGFDTAVISGAIIFLKTEFDLTDVDQEMIISVALAGNIH